MRGVVWLGSAAVVLLIAAAAVIGMRSTAPSRRPAVSVAPLPTRPAPAAPAKAAAAKAAPARPAPSFDIVTVDPQGHAVIAGRAAPGDRVRVLDNGKPIGAVTADARGEWVLLPQAPLAPGNRQLSLEATAPDGGKVRRSGAVVALSVTPAPAAGHKLATLAVLLPGDAGAPVKVLQRPGATPEGKPSLSLDTASWGAGDRLVLSGHAKPGARLNVYAGDRLLGTATADAAGAWSLAANQPHASAGVELRLDELAKGGAVAERMAAPLAQPAAAPPAAGGTYIVQRGNSLWLIARQIYGEGIRYTAIYSANRGKIQNPDLIYPGQRFKVPKS
jgi:LysM domain